MSKLIHNDVLLEIESENCLEVNFKRNLCQIFL